MSNFYFTITAGRTGTAWLANFLAINLDITAVHELLGIDDFGYQTPDLKVMRSFNDRGMDECCTSFWQRKFEGLKKYKNYAETNHTLAKCGLVEWVADSEYKEKTTFILLRRNNLRQCLSHLMRSDFVNTFIAWQWYLTPSYKNTIVNYKPFIKHGQLGHALWYVYEIEARQQYYKILFGNNLNMIEVSLEEITQPCGAKKFLEGIGVHSKPILPTKKNHTQQTPPAEIQKKIENLIASFSFDPHGLAAEYIKRGRRLDCI